MFKSVKLLISTIRKINMFFSMDDAEIITFNILTENLH